MSERKTIAVIGGTGAEGSGLALRWAHAGHTVVIGSRDAARAQAGADELNAILGKPLLTGKANADAVEGADIVVLTVPYTSQLATIEGLGGKLAGKILVDVTVPLVPPKVSTVQLPPSDSAAVALQALVGPEVKVASAFQNISAHKLKKLDHKIPCDVLVCCDDKDARMVVIGLAADAGLRGINAGPLANSTVAESLTSVLIWINRAYKIPDAGITITGLD
ncbi:MAG: Reduced coenzyme oxidoreductase [Tardiphaga sp.]|nr:Reduced coenzyme oxidoreductase [Tardiphaga sp.]